jgi:hypothetical protein
MKKNKRGDERDESSVQMALGELMGIEEERQNAEREEARRRAAEEVRRREQEEARRTAEEEARRRAAEERRAVEERAREEETRERQREAAEREARIRAEAEARVRAEESRRAFEHEIQMKRIDADGRRLPAWLAPIVAVLSLGGVVLFATLYFFAQEGATARLAEAEQARTSLRIELEREVAAARAESMTAISRLSDATRRFEDERRRLSETCSGIPVMVRPPKSRPGAAPRPKAGAQEGRDDDLDGLTEKPPWEADDSEDTIQLGKESKKGKGKKTP